LKKVSERTSEKRIFIPLALVTKKPKTAKSKDLGMGTAPICLMDYQQTYQIKRLIPKKKNRVGGSKSVNARASDGQTRDSRKEGNE